MPSFRRFLSALCSTFLVALAHAGTEKVIHTFNPAPQGYYPLGTVVSDQLGNLYGTAHFGGTNDAGVLYKASQNSQGTWTQTVLYNFLGGTGAYAPNQVVFDSAGNLYGFSTSVEPRDLAPRSNFHPMRKVCGLQPFCITSQARAWKPPSAA